MYKRNDGLSSDHVLQNQFTAYLRNAVHNRRINYYMKKSSAMRSIWKGRMIQHYPELLRRQKEKPIPRCNNCPDCKIICEGKRGNRHICHHKKILSKHKGTDGQHIPGRYARTSPAWCPKR